MKKGLGLVLGMVFLGGLLALIFSSPRTSTGTGHIETARCDYGNEKEVFSKKHYFSKDEATALLGKEVRNLKCGKIKCPLRSNECLNVEIGEVGKIVSIKPREGSPDYTVIIEWKEPRNTKDSFAEQGQDAFVSYVGNDKSYQIIE